MAFCSSAARVWGFRPRAFSVPRISASLLTPSLMFNHRRRSARCQGRDAISSAINDECDFHWRLSLTHLYITNAFSARRMEPTAGRDHAAFATQQRFGILGSLQSSDQRREGNLWEAVYALVA